MCRVTTLLGAVAGGASTVARDPAQWVATSSATATPRPRVTTAVPVTTSTSRSITNSRTMVALVLHQNTIITTDKTLHTITLAVITAVQVTVTAEVTNTTKVLITMAKTVVEIMEAVTLISLRVVTIIAGFPPMGKGNNLGTANITAGAVVAVITTTVVAV